MTNYTKDFFASPLKFMKKYAIAPPNNVEADKGKDVTTLDTTGFTPNVAATAQPASIRYACMSSAHKVAYIKFYKDKQMGAVPAPSRRGSMPCVSTLPTTTLPIGRRFTTCPGMKVARLSG